MYIIQTTEPRIALACSLSERFLKAVVSGEIDLPDSFSHTTHTPDQVRLHIASCMKGLPAPVGTYKTRSKIVGRFYKGRIEYNVTNLLRHDNAFIAGNMTHEVTHFFGYKHQGNFRNRNKNWLSVPYVLGDLCREWCLKNA
jgi:hypothetical protein